MDDSPPSQSSAPNQDSRPPRAFTQGVGTVFQFVGVLFFLAMMFVCCGSGLLSKETATHTNLTRVGWHLASDLLDHPVYSAQRAISISLFVGIFLGIALAGIGLGLQAQNRWSPAAAVGITLFGMLFWLVHTIFFVQILHSIWLVALSGILFVMFGILLMMSAVALREMRRDPPPRGHELLPEGYKIPYSHLHQDPPEIRLARELDQRRQRLAVQQKELEMLEEKLRKKLDQQKESS